MTKELIKRGFTPAIAEGTATHRDGNHLDQVWIKNVDLVRAVLAQEMLEWSDHRLIKLVVGAEVPHRRDNPKGQATEPVAIPLSAFPQSNIKKIMSDSGTLKHIEGVDLRVQPIIFGVPEDIAAGMPRSHSHRSHRSGTARVSSRHSNPGTWRSREPSTTRG